MNGRRTDPAIVELHKADALVRAGYFSADSVGRVLPCSNKLKVAVLQSFRERHVVAVRRDLAKCAVTKLELYRELLPQGLGVDSPTLTTEERLAHQQLAFTLGGYADATPDGFVRKGVESLGLEVCEARIFRTKPDAVTRKLHLTTAIGRFVTKDRELVLTPVSATDCKARLR